MQPVLSWCSRLAATRAHVIADHAKHMQAAMPGRFFATMRVPVTCYMWTLSQAMHQTCMLYHPAWTRQASSHNMFVIAILAMRSHSHVSPPSTQFSCNFSSTLEARLYVIKHYLPFTVSWQTLSWQTLS